MRRTVHLLATAIVLSLASVANAGLSLSIENRTVQAGDTTTVDVTLQGDVPLNFIDIIFKISTGGVTQLEFVSPVDDIQDALKQDNYLFFSDSFDIDLGSSFGNILPDPNGFNTTFEGVDGTSSGDDLPKSYSSSNNLLARLTVHAPMLSGTEMFLISVASYDLENSTSGDPITLDSITGGQITVTDGPVAAVPEPATLVASLSGILALLVGVGPRRRSAVA